MRFGSVAVWAVIALAPGEPGRAQANASPPCLPDNAGLTLPAGFCALIVADSVGLARHIAVAPDGDIFVALSGSNGGVLALRDADHDGIAEVRERFGPGRGGSGIAIRGEYIYFAPNDAVLRYRRVPESLLPATPPDTIVKDLPAERSHSAKTITFGRDGALYVNIGSPSNVCEARSGAEPTGHDPCPELETRAGIWRFSPDRSGQTQADGQRWATGLRNTVALTRRPRDSALYGVVHGRDRLFQNWPRYYDEREGAELPAEVLVRIEEGDDYGWPYCYWNHQRNRYVLAPEYGGDEDKPGRCGGVKEPVAAFPGHWAPNGALFYSGTQFPAQYRDGVFIAFHGSWNRAPLPQQGATVVFVPFRGNEPMGGHQMFATGFGGPDAADGQWQHRPVGLAQGPDGSLYITDDRGGRIYRVLYRGNP